MLSGVADAIPKSGDGEVEMIRMLKSAKDSAVKARTQAVNQIKDLEAGLERFTRKISPALVDSFPGGQLWHRTRHSGDSPHCCGE